jgi:hypothetical protein
LRLALVLALKSSALSEPDLTFSPVTAPFLSCLVPTLLAGKVSAAYDDPPSATNSASVAIVFA